MMNNLIQGQCNCKKCREERSTIHATTSVFRDLKTALPFIPDIFKVGHRLYAWKNEKEINTAIVRTLKQNEKTHEAVKRKGYYRYCVECGIYHKLNSNYKITRNRSPRYICGECVIERHIVCYNCDLLITANRQRNRDLVVRYGHDSTSIDVLVDGKRFCQPCADKLFHRCIVCQDRINHFHSETFDPRDIYGTHELGRFTRRPCICKSCHERYVQVCDECESPHYRSGGVRDGAWKCPTCHEKDLTIHSFNYKPPPCFRRVKTEGKHRLDALYLGFELEVELFASGNWALREFVGDKVLKFMGSEYVYNKHDGSLLNGGASGFEIVSHPQTWYEYRAQRKKWKELFVILGKNKVMASSSRCGMHVHMNKSAFTTHQTYKFVDFVYNPAHRDFIVYVSGREGYNQYFSHFASLDGYRRCKKNAKLKTGAGHHTAVDLSPSQTFEVRIFAGTLDFITFQKNLEFCKALYEFTIDNSRMENTVFKFVRWLNKPDHRTKYRNLFNYIVNNTEVCHQYGLLPLLKKRRK
jgi:hypothetical protein